MAQQNTSSGFLANLHAVSGLSEKLPKIVLGISNAIDTYKAALKDQDSDKLSAVLALLESLIEQFYALTGSSVTGKGEKRSIRGGSEEDIIGAAEGCMCNAIYGSSAIGDLDKLAEKRGGDDMDVINSAHMNAIIDTFEKVGVTFRNKKNIETVVADIEKMLPCNGGHPFNNNLAAQPAIIRTIAVAVNAFVRAHSKVDFDIVNVGASATPETMLSELCDWIGTFRAGMFSQRAIVERIVTRLVEDMNSAFAIMEHAYSKLTGPGAKQKDTIALMKSLYESARDSYKKSAQIFQDYLKIRPQEFKTVDGLKSIEGEVFRNGRVGVKVSTEKFGDAVAYLLNLMKSNAELATSLTEQLTKLGITLSVSEIEGMTGEQFNESVLDKIPHLTRNSSADEIKNFELSRKSLLSLYTAIKNNAAAAKFPSAQRNMVRGRGENDSDDDYVSDVKTGGYAIQGSVKTYTALEEERMTDGLRIVQEYGEVIQVKFKKFYESVIVVIASLTKEDKAIDFTELSGILTNLAELLKNGRGNLDKELLNVAGAKVEHQSKKQYIAAINLLINVFKRFAQQRDSVDFKPVIDVLLSIEPTIEHFATRLSTKNISLESAQLDSYLMTNNEILTNAINHLKYKVYLHNMGLNLLKVSKTYASYSEKYTETMGRAIASCIQQTKTNINNYYEIVKTENNIKTEIAKAEKVINNFYRAIQAIDLYILKTNRQITQNTHLHIDVFKLLSDAKMIAEWYSDDIGDKLFKLAENDPDFNVDKLFAEIKDGKNDEYTTAKNEINVNAETIPVITKLKDINNEIYDKFQALKNIVSIFSRITVLETNSDIFMNPAQIYNAFLDFIKFTTFIYQTNKSLKIDDAQYKKINFRLMKCDDELYNNELDLFSSAIGAMTSSIITTLNLYELQNSQSVMPCNLMKTRLILGGSLSDEFKIIPSAVNYYFRLVRLAEFYKMVFYDYENVNKLELQQAGGTSAEYSTSLANIKKHIESYLDTNIDIAKYPFIVWDSKSFNIMDAYLDEVKSGRTGNYRISMSPELDGVFSELNSFISFNSTENGEYSDGEITKLIVIINKIYNYYSTLPNGSVDMAVNDYIEQVNRKFSLFSIEEYGKVKNINKKLQLEMVDDYTTSISNNYSILQGENSLAINNQINIFAPSDNYKQGNSSSESSNYNLNSVKNAITTFNSRFSKLLSNCNNTTTYASLLLYTENELKKSSSEDVKFEILRSIIKNVGVNNNNNIDSYMYHETIRTGITALESINNSFCNNREVTECGVSTSMGILSSPRSIISALCESKYITNKNGTKIAPVDDEYKIPSDAIFTENFNRLIKINKKFDITKDAHAAATTLITAIKDKIVDTGALTDDKIKQMYLLLANANFRLFINKLYTAITTNDLFNDLNTDIAAAVIQAYVTSDILKNAATELLTGDHNTNRDRLAASIANVFNTYRNLPGCDINLRKLIIFLFIIVSDSFDTLIAPTNAALVHSSNLANRYNGIDVNNAAHININNYFIYAYLCSRSTHLFTLLNTEYFKEGVSTLREINNYLVRMTNPVKNNGSEVGVDTKYVLDHFDVNKLKNKMNWKGILYSGISQKVKTNYINSFTNDQPLAYQYLCFRRGDAVNNNAYIETSFHGWTDVTAGDINAALKLYGNLEYLSYTFVDYIINNKKLDLDGVKNIFMDISQSTYSSVELKYSDYNLNNIIDIAKLHRNFSNSIQKLSSSFLKTNTNKIDISSLEVSVDISKCHKTLIESINSLIPIFSPFITSETIKQDYSLIKKYTTDTIDKYVLNFNDISKDYNEKKLFQNLIGFTTAPFRPSFGDDGSIIYIPILTVNKPYKLMNQLNYAITEYLSIISDNTIIDLTTPTKGLYAPALTYLRNEVLRSFDFNCKIAGKNETNYFGDKQFIDSKFNNLVSSLLTVKTGGTPFTTNLISELSSSNKSLIKGKLPKLLNDLKKYKKMASLYKIIFNNTPIVMNSYAQNLNNYYAKLHGIDPATNLECDLENGTDVLTFINTYIDFNELFETVGNTNTLYIKHNGITTDYKANIILDVGNLKSHTINSTDVFFSNVDTFCTNFIALIEKLLKEFADTSPVFMETSEGVLDYYIMNKNSAPIMPISAVLLNNNDTKFMYATRYVNYSSGKIKPAHVPSIYKTLASFSAVHSSINVLSEVELTNYINNIFNVIRILKDINADINYEHLAYSLEPKFTSIEDKVFNQCNILDFISNYMSPKQGDNNRINEIISSFIELNVMPININSLMQSVPLINIMNYSSGLNDMVANSTKFTQIQKDLFINTFKPATFTTSTYRISCYNWLVDNQTRPKFIYDQIYTKVLMQPETVPTHVITANSNLLTPNYCKKVADLLFTLLHSKTLIQDEEITKYIGHDVSSVTEANIIKFINNDTTNLGYAKRTSLNVNAAAILNGTMNVGTGTHEDICAYKTNIFNYLRIVSYIDSLLINQTPNKSGHVAQSVSNAILYLSQFTDKHIQYKFTYLHENTGGNDWNRFGIEKVLCKLNRLNTEKVANDRYKSVLVRALLYITETQRFINSELNEKLSIGKTSIINSLSLMGSNVVNKNRINNNVIFNDSL